MTEVIRSISEWKRIHRELTAHGQSVGFVPTMGALHAGHISLIEMSRRENNVTVTSIFVNPTQFNNPSDLEKYPRTFETDLAQLSRAGCNYLFYPEYKDLYPDQFRYQVQEKELSRNLCGADRPGHFDGVLTVVMKLFQIIRPMRAYFGEKDFQQLSLIQGMVDAFFLDIEIKPGATVRETDGLAMSSRNVRLTPNQRELAPQFYKLLKSSGTDQEATQELEKLKMKVEYITTLNHRRYGAVWLGDVRLIDNVKI